TERNARVRDERRRPTGFARVGVARELEPARGLDQSDLPGVRGKGRRCVGNEQRTRGLDPSALRLAERTREAPGIDRVRLAGAGLLEQGVANVEPASHGRDESDDGI